MRLGVVVEAGFRSEAIPGVGWESSRRGENKAADRWVHKGAGGIDGAVMMITVIQLLLIY
jgi:hypothetical protein